jgi:hypothetical protein
LGEINVNQLGLIEIGFGENGKYKRYSIQADPAEIIGFKINTILSVIV